MIRVRRRVAAVCAVAASLMLTSCAVNEAFPGTATGVSGIVIGGGSSAQQSAQEAWIVGFQTVNQGATVEYDPAGSGAGREMFIAGGTAFAASDRAYTIDEIEESAFDACTPGTEIFEIPAYISPIAVAFSLDGITSLNMDAATIAGIFAGEIERWNDDAITATNPDVDLPDQVITPVHRSDDSGVTENFTSYLHATAPDVWTYEEDGVWPFDGGEAAQGNSGVVDTTINGSGTIAYIDASRVGELGVVSVQVGAEFVPYSSEAAAAIVDVSPIGDGRSEFDLAVEIDRTSTEAGVYPIVLLSYLIGCMDYVDKGDAELVQAYFTHVISEEGQLAAADHAGSAPISPRLFERASAIVERIG